MRVVSHSVHGAGRFPEPYLRMVARVEVGLAAYISKRSLSRNPLTTPVSCANHADEGSEKITEVAVDPAELHIAPSSLAPCTYSVEATCRPIRTVRKPTLH